MPSTSTNGRRRDRETQKGHGTAAFGPSDPTDIAGASGIIESDITGLDHAADEGIDGTPTRTAAAALGDAHLDSDSDSVATGEHMTDRVR